MGRSKEEFPLLTECKLQIVNTQGNGNCLFHALSDQMYGDQSHHKEIRARVIEHMRNNGDWYKSFLTVHSGGGTRRNPKRKNAGSFATTIANDTPTPEEVDACFERHLEEMARGGTYGDNMELNAFSNAYGYHVKIWHPEGLPWLSMSENNTHGGQVLHIALHSYEHYSSIRNMEGPHTGLPMVRDPETYDPAVVEGRKGRTTRATGKAVELAPWKIQAVKHSLPYIAETNVINRALMKHNGDIDEAVSYLIENEDVYSAPSSPGSSSIERDQDTEDEEEYSTGSRKKQDRRQSRATKQKLASQQQTTSLSHRPKTTDTKDAATTAADEDEDDDSPPRKSISPHRRSAHNIIDDSDEDSDDGDSLKSSQKSSQTSMASTTPSTTTITSKGSFKGTNLQQQASSSFTATSTANPNKEQPYRGTAAKSSSAPTARGRGTAQTKQRPGGKPKLSAAAQKDLKKRAQKAAAKERKQGLANGKASSGNAIASVSFQKGRSSPPTAGLGSLLI